MQRAASLLLPLAALAIAIFALACTAQAAPRAELWQRWAAHSPGTSASVDHGAWDLLLGRYLTPHEDGVARFDYAGVSAADRRALDGYIAALEGVDVDALARPEQFASWVNLYNAVTVKTVLDHYPVDSIRDIDISPGLFADGPWGKALAEVAGEPLSLDDIEHRILRPIWRDPRVHYAVNCAALGCPNLAPRAFTAANTEAQLEAAARAYVNHPRGVMARRGKLVVSSIYIWFKADFGNTDPGVIDHLKAYARPDLAARLMDARRIDDHTYDWALNGIASPGS